MADLGLCATCCESTDCRHRSSSSQPVRVCDQYRPAGCEPVSCARPDEPSEAPDNGDHLMGRRIGLCVNCENRFTCQYPEPPGGVWHCEEYC